MWVRLYWNRTNGWGVHGRVHRQHRLPTAVGVHGRGCCAQRLVCSSWRAHGMVFKGTILKTYEKGGARDSRLPPTSQYILLHFFPGTRALVHLGMQAQGPVCPAPHLNSSMPANKDPITCSTQCSANHRRGLHSLTAVGGRLYLFGGAPQRGAMLRDLWVLDTGREQLQVGRGRPASPSQTNTKTQKSQPRPHTRNCMRMPTSSSPAATSPCPTQAWSAFRGDEPRDAPHPGISVGVALPSLVAPPLLKHLNDMYFIQKQLAIFQSRRSKNKSSLALLLGHAVSCPAARHGAACTVVPGTSAAPASLERAGWQHSAAPLSEQRCTSR